VVEIPKWNRNYVQEGKPVAGAPARDYGKIAE
jgi:hypothetical protein